jgi:UPF0755 protein
MKRAGIIAALAAAILLLAGAASYVAWQVSRVYRGWPAPVFVEIVPGSSSRAIAAQLRGAGVLRSQWPFLLLHYLSPRQKLKAGEYLFDRPLSVRQVLGKIARGEIYYHTITIPEGYNLFDVIEAVTASGLAPRADVEQAVKNTALVADLDPGARTLEGYLFPDTYYFARHTAAREMAAAMVNRFRRVYAQLESRYHPPRSVHDLVTLASLIEKETGLASERPLVASVFYNRQRAGLPLQCDPTVIYAAVLAGRYRGNIYQSDLDHDSPYNTYRRRVLPPGPIANPGRASVEAAMAPAHSDYLFFVSNGHNGHHFSNNIKEHGRAVAAYRRRK